jgi:hypothetical protein
MKSALILGAIVVSALAAACNQDPVHNDAVAALGPEAPGVAPGPNHRPGQPCVTCHGGSGPASRQFSIGGTAYLTQVTPYPDGGSPPASPPAAGATVSLTDSKNSKFSTMTTESGNFFVYLTDWAPVAPIGGVTTDGGVPDQSHAIQIAQGTNLVVMYSHIGRDGSCSDCHFYPPGPLTPGPIWLTAPIVKR